MILWLLCDALFGVCGVLLALVGRRFVASGNAFSRRAIATNGRIVGHTAFSVMREGDDTRMTEARIRFRANGQDHETKGYSEYERLPPVRGASVTA